ncbi:pyocin activator PrtN family protein [Faucicola mancuniensis]|uniref:pyocin activator PrtN family protein n=1 Tax=Faucicola mancuniensis TaxID=1309795 RepID=UPI0028E7DEFA|nr:pyocin activator PrtN family protein [uncultured Moraxella sp.]
MNTEIDIATMLFLRYKNPVVSLETILADYLPHMNQKTAGRKAKNCQLPFPAFQTGGGGWFVNLVDFAPYLEQQRQEAKRNWENMQCSI